MLPHFGFGKHKVLKLEAKNSKYLRRMAVEHFDLSFSWIIKAFTGPGLYGFSRARSVLGEIPVFSNLKDFFNTISHYNINT
jgi:hypothetical protein